jgi:hypothetical protein
MSDPTSPAAGPALATLLAATSAGEEAEPPCEGRVALAPPPESDFAPGELDELVLAASVDVGALPRHVRGGAGIALAGLRRNRGDSARERH